MPRENVLVEEVSELTATAAAETRYRAVVFAGGSSARLDLEDSRATGWLAALEEMRAAGLIAYVEVDPRTGAIVELLCPLPVVVGDLRESDDGVDVELVVSQARHRLSRGNPDFGELLAALRRAYESQEPVLVTETLDEHEIIDVRPDPKVRAESVEAGESEVLGTPVTLAKANEMFTLVNNRTACSANPIAPGIPFTYPDDGCWGRAHEMCRLMIGAGVQPDKVWIYGDLRVVSFNKPDCNVRWGWHVAPTLTLTTGETYVVDPALFPNPVPRATWASVQGDPAASLVPTGADVFYRSFGGGLTFDPTYSETNSVLARYRTQLQLRAAGTSGPPPYFNCLTRPPRTQFFGTIAGNTSHRWFTFGWPANWHVLWTIMPTLICPGTPTLSWSVAVERAGATQATYWITVTNSSPHTVRFEGRYDVLST
ncbi:hypothetical protein C8D88_12912 [Lentzea atacamensis]|uniref:Protein glutaminase domain-containing protein n=1 Tax=Lentzea atacamensis TaxID=531938 RepID=A0A316HBU2_9PSEU|nr:protein-glutamine glutaminase family protein [Lentzea atacamensis]PWK77996.1 hypothetical protein C8D88_12912 [Lentzea atacamensis]